MERIASFNINHETLKKGIYLSREDGNIKTVDLRMRAPYRDKLLSNSEMHSLEHILATVLRNGKYKNKVVYVGPMGCQTGFYCLFKDLTEIQIINEITGAFKNISESELQMPGSSKTECGNCLNLDIVKAKKVASQFYRLIKDNTKFNIYN